MLDQNRPNSPDEFAPTAEWLLDRVKEVRGYLRRNGFSRHAIEHAVTALYLAAMPYVKGTKVCELTNPRAWAFKVAIRAAIRATKRDVKCTTVDPGLLPAPVEEPECGDELVEVAEAMKQLTEKQSTAVELCIVRGMSQREAAKHMGIAVGTLCAHLRAAKKRLKDILDPVLPLIQFERYSAGARASFMVERQMPPAVA